MKDNIVLFCLPYAGGSANVFNAWKEHLHDSINLYPIELAGRGMRFSESLYLTMDEAVSDIYDRIKDKLFSSRFAFFGHSMGSVLLIELLFKIKQMNHRAPIHAFLSGRNPPQSIGTGNNLHNQSDEVLLKEIYRLGGTTKTFFENKELHEIFIPIIRSDYKILEDYIYKPRMDSLDCNISILNGTDDPEVDLSLVGRWSEFTEKDTYFMDFSGGHFFIIDKQIEVVNYINLTLIKAQQNLYYTISDIPE